MPGDCFFYCGVRTVSSGNIGVHDDAVGAEGVDETIEQAPRVSKSVEGAHRNVHSGHQIRYEGQ